MTTRSPWRVLAIAVVKLCWAGSLCAAVGGAFVGITTIATAKGAPQEAAGAAFGCLIAIAPYVFARSLQELFRGDAP